MFVRFVGLVTMAAVGFAAWSSDSVQSFEWRASGRFTLRVGGGKGGTKEITGDMREGDKAQVKEGGLTADLKSYPGFVSVALSDDGVDDAQLFLFERQNANFVLMNGDAAVRALATGINIDLDAALDAGKRVNGWDVSLTFRAMVDYFKANPGKRLSDFADALEVGRLRSVPKPVSRASPSSQSGQRQGRRRGNDGGGPMGQEWGRAMDEDQVGPGPNGEPPRGPMAGPPMPLGPGPNGPPPMPMAPPPPRPRRAPRMPRMAEPVDRDEGGPPIDLRPPRGRVMMADPSLRRLPPPPPPQPPPQQRRAPSVPRMVPMPPPQPYPGQNSGPFGLW